MANPIVVDLSHHNPEPDWEKLKAGGTVGVILKATENTGYQDPTLYRRGAAARQAGLKSATYHFLRPGSMRDQMAFYLSVVDPLPGERMVIDHEDAKVSLTALEDAVNSLLGMRPDVQVSIYSGHLIKEQLGNGRSEILAAKTSLWIAQYNNTGPSWPTATWPAWSLWQYTDKATVSGISKPVDGNQWNGSTENLLKWFGPTSEPAPGPTPEPEAEIVKVAISVPPGVEIEVTVNGQTL